MRMLKSLNDIQLCLFFFYYLFLLAFQRLWLNWSTCSYCYFVFEIPQENSRIHSTCIYSQDTLILFLISLLYLQRKWFSCPGVIVLILNDLVLITYLWCLLKGVGIVHSCSFLYSLHRAKTCSLYYKWTNSYFSITAPSH